MPFTRFVSAAAVAVFALSGCVDSPSSLASPASDADPLAQTFEALARDAAASGDVSRSEGFTYAAIAARSGITPSRLDIRNGTTLETYDAFVNAIEWKLTASVAQRVPAHRTITAWRRTSNGVTRILSLTTPSDSAPVLNPLSLSATGPVAAAYAGAGGLYQETTAVRTANTGTTVNTDAWWIAVAGFVKVRETVTGAACPKPPASIALSGVTCQQARFLVQFDVGMQQLSRRPYEVSSGVTARRFGTPAEQVVNGYRLAFSCATVTATKGCG